MAAPSGTVWGSTVGSYGRIGIYTKVTNTSNTQSSVYVSVWFWSKYSVSDSSNQYYYNNNATSATTLIGSRSIKTTVSSGSGWSTSNQVMLADTTYTINRGTSSTKYNLAAKLSGIDRVGGTMTVTSSYTVPAKPSYKIYYNANGGTGAPGTQTKYYGTNITLSSTKPTRTGYTFQGWGTTASDTSVNYAAGASYTSNAGITLYAIWKANTYTVTYNANGGTGAPGNQTKTYGKTLVLSSTKPTRTNYNFVGWGTSAKDTAAKYNPGSNYTVNASITLYAIWKVAYIKPRITNFKVTRCTNKGVIADDGTYAKVTCNWATDKTVSSVKVDWKLSTASTYGTATTVTASGTSGSVSVVVGGGTLYTENPYNIRVTVADADGNNNLVLTLPSMKYIIDFLKGGTGIAFGKVAKEANHVESAWPIYSYHSDIGFTQAREATGRSIMFGVGSGGQNRGIFDRDLDADSGEWMMHRDSSNNVNITGNDIRLYSHKANSNFIPYYKKGDAYSITYQGAGFIASSGTKVYFSIPVPRYILGTTTITASSVTGLMLRQDGKYLYGGNASNYVKPSSYSVTLEREMGLRITATMSNTTNVVNNHAVGITWDGMITFS